jgi:DNA-binding XRE family transcriptional regulator
VFETTLGEHLMRRRLALGLTPKEACALLDHICVEALINWEKGKTEPPIPFLLAILAFLGPFATPRTLGERMHATRRTMGWTIREAAERIGVDESTWWTWEPTGCVRWERYRLLLEALLQDQDHRR